MWRNNRSLDTFDKYFTLTEEEQEELICYLEKFPVQIEVTVNRHTFILVHAAPDAKDGYRFSKAMKNPRFISIDDIISTYLPLGFSNFKIEGRGVGSAVDLEFLLYYLTKQDYQLTVREEIYLDSILDLF